MMPIKYTENHHLHYDADEASVHVALHLQGADLPATQLFVSRVLDVAGGFVRSYVSALPDGAIWPQTSGPCVHCTRYGEDWVDRIDEMPSMELVAKINDVRGKYPELNLPGSEKTITMARPELIRHLKRVAGTDAVASCTYPREDLGCPHLDTPEILCPIKDSCYAMREIASLREACVAEQEGQDQAMREIASLREACVAEQEEQDQDMAADQVPRSDYVLAPRDPQEPVTDTEEPEFPAPEPEETPVYKTKGQVPAHIQMWTPEENAVLASATSRQEAITLIRERFPDSIRSDGAIMRQWYEVRPPLATAPPDGRQGSWSAEEDAVLLQETAVTAAVQAYQAKFGDAKRTYAALSSRYYRIQRKARKEGRLPAPAGDKVPVTQSVEPARAPEPAPRKGLYGDAKALRADRMDGARCDRPHAQEPAEVQNPRDCAEPLHPWIGMRVRVLDPLDLINRTGVVREYALEPRELLVTLDESPDRVWLPPESLLLIGAGRTS